VGDRSRKSAKRLWAKIPLAYRQHATFYTDQYVVYAGVIPAAQHRAIHKLARKTNHIERFNNTLRQRVSRLVRETLSFSKKLANHVGAIKYFICLWSAIIRSPGRKRVSEQTGQAAWVAKPRWTIALPKSIHTTLAQAPRRGPTLTCIRRNRLY
jgi:IS1 family transposase